MGAEPTPRFRDQVHNEFTTWLATGTLANPDIAADLADPTFDRLHPPLDDPDTRLPDGWNVLARTPCNDLDVLYHLFNRDAGGWALLFRYESGRVVFGAAISDLCAWYTGLQQTIERIPSAPNRLPRALVAWARPIISSLFDPEDPAEAAEQMLFAFTGRIMTPPRAAHYAHGAEQGATTHDRA
jgi:hypothetical protein